MKSSATGPTVAREEKAPIAISPVATWATTPKRLNARCGFTLLEVLAVLLILGLVSGVAVVRLKQPYRVARLGEAVGRIALMDRQARDHSRRFGCPSRLVYDLDHGVAYVESGGVEHKEYSRVNLPSGVRLERLLWPNGQADQGRPTIDIFCGGQSSSYAVRLAVGGDSHRWLFFTGLTGQGLEFTEEDDDVKRLFQMLQPSGADAD